MTHKTRVIVAGAGYAGMRAAFRLARKSRGLPVEITLVNAADHFVERVRLHQLAADQPLKQISIPKLAKGTGVQFVQGWITELDPIHKRLAVKTSAGERWLDYDKLVYALGSYTDQNILPGVADHTLSVSTEATARTLRERLPEIAAGGGHVVVVGGGLTGIESATEIAEAYPGLKVKLVTAGTFGGDLSVKGSQHIRTAFRRHRIELADQTRVTAVHSGELETTTGTIAFDLCLWAGPFTAPPLAGDSGLTVNGRGQILVDEHLRSVSHPDIFAIGDAAGLENAVDITIRMACATGVPMGGYVADQILAELDGKSLRPYHFNYYVRCISLGRRDGLIQFVKPDDTPVEFVLTGRGAARFKETICRYAAWQPRAERWMPVHVDDWTTQQRPRKLEQARSGA
jgi:NADH dehydrogenase